MSILNRRNFFRSLLGMPAAATAAIAAPAAAEPARWQRPNPTQTWGDMEKDMAWQLTTTGTASVWLVPNRAWGIAELYVLPTVSMVPRAAEPMFPRGSYLYVPLIPYGAFSPEKTTQRASIIPEEQVLKIQRWADAGDVVKQIKECLQHGKEDDLRGVLAQCRAAYDFQKMNQIVREKALTLNEARALANFS